MQTQLYAVAFDASFIHKSGKHTPCTGYFWSGCAGKTLRGLEVLSLSLVDADSRMSFHFSMRDTKVLFHNALLLQRFFAMFGNPPNY